MVAIVVFSAPKGRTGRRNTVAACTAIVGINWGDEGKGRMVDLLTENFDVVVRFQGGGNAGHTIVNRYGEFMLHLLPSGVFRKDVVNNPYFAEDGPLGEFVKALNNPDALLGGQLIGVNFENWAGYHYDMAGEMQSYLLGETTFDEFFDAYAEFNETAIDNYFAENPDGATDIFRLRDIVGEAE